MRYVSTSTDKTLITRKRFKLIDAEPRSKTKTITFRPEDLWVTYCTKNGNTAVQEARISGPRVLKDGSEGNTVDERLWRHQFRDADTAPFARIIERESA